MAIDTPITLNGTNYLKFPLVDDFYPKDSICVDFDLTLPDWNQPYSSQLVGNFKNQGYGVFYQKGLEQVIKLSIMDQGNSHLFSLNSGGALISQRSMPPQTNPVNLTTQAIDRLENKAIFDAGNNKIFILDTNNILLSEFTVVGTLFDIARLDFDSVGNLYIYNRAESVLLKYTKAGLLLSSTAHASMDCSMFGIDRNDMPVFYYANDHTPLLFDCENSHYTLFGVNIHKNGVPFFTVGSNSNGIGIDGEDNIWVVRNDNEILKVTTAGKVLFNKKFHSIEPCDPDPCDTSTTPVSISFTRELTSEGVSDYTWVILKNSNYALKLNSNGTTVDCTLTTSLLNVEKFTDTSYSAVSVGIDGDFTSFRSKKNFGQNCDNTDDSLIVAKIAVVGVCDGAAQINILEHKVTDLNGTHSIKFLFDGSSGVGSLVVDGVVVDTFTQKGSIHYTDSNLIPTLVGADSGDYRSLKEELGDQNPQYTIATIDELLISRGNGGNFVERSNTGPLRIELPTPNHISYQETVRDLFLFRSNGYKSPTVNLKISDSGFTDVSSQLIISEDITTVFGDNTPVPSKINTIGWVETVRLKDI